MDKRLVHTPDYYHQKLIEYAKDTVEYQTLHLDIKYKVNQNGHPTVVENRGEYFKIYHNQEPQIRILVVQPRNSSYRSMFFANVYPSEHELRIEVFTSSFQKIANIIFFLLFAILNIWLICKNDYSFVMFSLFLLVVFIFNRIARKRYRKFIITFLNNL